jgi:acylphosphatase
MKTVRVIVRGRVQGVGFRAFVEREAVARGLAGWVRNRRDGTVEAVLSGDDAAVDRMLIAMREGPRGAAVAAVEVSEWPEAVGSTFEVKPTA